MAPALEPSDKPKPRVEPEPDSATVLRNLRDQLTLIQNASLCGMARHQMAERSWQFFDTIWRASLKVEKHLIELERSDASGS